MTRWTETSLCPQTDYRKVPKFLDTRNFCCNLPKIQTKKPNLREIHQKGTNGIANSEDPDQIAPLSDLGLHCLPRPICPKTWVITVASLIHNFGYKNKPSKSQTTEVLFRLHCAMLIFFHGVCSQHH